MKSIILNIRVTYFSLEGTLTKPTIWLVLFLAAGNSASEVAVLVNFRKWASELSEPFLQFQMTTNQRKFISIYI